MPLPTDRAVFLTTDEAAARFGVQPGTIRQWVRRGHLEPAGRLPAGGSSVYRLEDLARADDATRRKAGRPSQAERARARLRVQGMREQADPHVPPDGAEPPSRPPKTPTPPTGPGRFGEWG